MKSVYEKSVAAWEELPPGEDDAQIRHEEDNGQAAVHITAAGKREDTQPGAGNQASQLAQQVDMNHRREGMEQVPVLVAREDELHTPRGQQELRHKMAEGTVVVDMSEGHSWLSSG